MNKKYVKLEWEIDDEESPYEIYSEIINGWEVRKIEFFENGDVFYATESEEVGTFLATEEYPDFEAITVDSNCEKLTPKEISEYEFEKVWLKYINNKK